MKKFRPTSPLSIKEGYDRFLFSFRVLSFFFLFSSLFILASCQPAANKEKAAIKAVMKQQEQAWNNGELEGFMQGYWKSDSLLFIGSKGLTYGWETTLANYQKGYPTKEEMGTLKFTIKKIIMITPFEAWMVGQWKLTREKDTPQGHFTLLWKKIEGNWKIVADHTS